MTKRSLALLLLCSSSLGCPAEGDESADSLLGDSGTSADELDGDTEVGDTTTGDGDATTGDGDATTTGDGDATTTGDGDATTGDGDTTTGDGDTTTGEDTSPCDALDPGWGAPAQVGQPAPHFSGTNQDGEEVSICAYEGVPIVIDTSAVWCGPCQMMSTCLGGDDNLCLQLFGGNQDALTYLMHPLRDAINAGTFAWVTVLTENYNSGPPALSDAQAWDQQFPVDNVWVIPDVEQKYYGHLPLEAFPSFWLIDEQMNWQDLDQMTVFTTIINEL